MKKTVNWLITISLGIIFLLIWLRIVDWEQLIHYFQQISIGKGILFSFFYLLAYFFRSLRWCIILRPIKKIPVTKIFPIFMTGMLVNYLIPVRAGELVKSLLLKSKFKIRIANSLPTVLIDKIFDLLPILLILFLIPLLSLKISVFLQIIILILLGIFSVFVFFLYFSINHKKKSIFILGKILFFIPITLRAKVDDFIKRFVDGITIFEGRLIPFFLMILITFLAVFSEAYFIYSIFIIFGASISYAKILFGYTLMNLTYILPTPPAQIGSNQFMWTVIFSFALGIEENLTGAAVTFSHLLTAAIICGIGIISFLLLKISYHDLLISNIKVEENYESKSKNA